MRFNITKLFDDAKAKATDAGQQLVDLIQYLSEFCELTGRSLRNGLTFADNFNGEVVTLSLQSGVETPVSAKRKVIGIIPMRVQTTDNIMITGFGWRYTSNGEFAVKFTFNPAPTSSFQVTVVLLY